MVLQLANSASTKHVRVKVFVYQYKNTFSRMTRLHLGYGMNAIALTLNIL